MEMIPRLELYMILRDKRRLKLDVMDNILMNYHFTNLNREMIKVLIILWSFVELLSIN